MKPYHVPKYKRPDTQHSLYDGQKEGMSLKRWLSPEDGSCLLGAHYRNNDSHLHHNFTLINVFLHFHGKHGPLYTYRHTDISFVAVSGAT